MDRIQSVFPRCKRLLCVMLAGALLTGSAAFSHTVRQAPTVLAEESVDDLRDQQAALAEQEQALEAQKNASAQTLEEKQAEKDRLQQQIDIKTQEIEVSRQLVSKIDDKISDKTYEIAQKEQSIGQKEAEIADQFDALCARLRTISKSGTLTSSLQLLMNTDNYADYLIKSKAMERVSASDQALMDSLESELQIIQTEKASLEEDKAVLAEERAPLIEAQTALETAKAELDSLYSQVNVIVDQLNQDLSYYTAEIERAEAAQNALQEQIDELIRTSVGSGTAYLSGSMYWPAPTCTYISSLYKSRWGRLHGGIDITGSGCYGDPITAAADGVVSIATWDDSYGYYIVLDHGTDSAGQRIMTLYAHSSQLLVSVGQSVSAGETIALIGSTGNSTGAHLHFEVRVDGDRVDPIENGYVSTSGITVDESL